MIWVSIALSLSLMLNLFLWWVIRKRTINFLTQINTLNVRFVKIMEKYEDMLLFVDGILNNKEFADAYIHHEPVIQSLIRQIRDFHYSLVSIFDADVTGAPFSEENEATIPEEINEESTPDRV